MANEKPNILLIVTDQWRGDCIGFQGHPVVETPNIDNLFGNGVSFTQAYTAVPSCIAARAALFTGLSQKSHGRTGYRDRLPWNYPVTLPGVLAAAGYHTHCAGKMHVFPARSLMGFHSVDLCDGYLHNERRQKSGYELVDDYRVFLRETCGAAADITDAGVGCNGYSVSPWPYEERCHMTNWVTTRSMDFLRRRDPTKPFFLKVSYHRPHPPLDPPRNYLDRYLGKTLPPVAMGDWVRHSLRHAAGFDSPIPSSPAQIDLARRAYFAQLTHIDCQINRLCHALDEYGLVENTVVLFVSDHGEMLYDHNLVGKSHGYDASARVPLLVRFPGSFGFGKASIDAPVELRDLMPTILDIAGVPVPASVEGKSLLPFCRGERPAWREYIHGEHPSGAQSNQWVTNGKEMYIWYSQTGEEQFFDLALDPHNLKDLAAKEPGRVAPLRQFLIQELEGREEGYVAAGKLVIGRLPQANSRCIEI